MSPLLLGEFLIHMSCGQNKTVVFKKSLNLAKYYSLAL
jgi:hypothetical protein